MPCIPVFVYFSDSRLRKTVNRKRSCEFLASRKANISPPLERGRYFLPLLWALLCPSAFYGAHPGELHKEQLGVRRQMVTDLYPNSQEEPLRIKELQPVIGKDVAASERLQPLAVPVFCLEHSRDLCIHGYLRVSFGDNLVGGICP